MPVRWKNVEMPLGGADQYTDAPHVMPGKMRELENVRFRRPPTCSKRYGFEELGVGVLDSADTVTAGVRLGALGKETILLDDKYLLAYSETDDEWSPRGDVSKCHVERRRTWYDAGVNLQHWDIAYNQGIVVIGAVGASATLPRCVVLHDETRTVLNTQGLNVSVQPRLFALGNYIYAISIAGNTLSYTRIDVTSGAYEFPAVASLGITTAASSPLFDCHPVGAAHFIVAYANSSTGALHVAKIDIATHTADASDSSADTPTQSIGVHANTDGVVVAYDDNGGGVKAWTFTSGLVEVDAEFSVGGTDAFNIGVAPIDSTGRAIIWRENGSGTRHDYTTCDTIAIGTGNVGTAQSAEALIPMSKPFEHNGRVYGWVAYESAGAIGTPASGADGPNGGDQETAFLLEYTDASGAPRGSGGTASFVWIATAARGILNRVTEESWLPGVASLGSDRYETTISIKTKLDFAGDDDVTVRLARSGIDRVRADFGTSKLHQVVPFGNGLFIAGGRPSWYDGHTLAEAGFSWRPENVWFAMGGAGSGELDTGGAYLFAACYEWTDSRGNLHRSAPSESVSLTPGANDARVTLTVQETLLTQHGGFSVPTVGAFSNVRIIGYRSVQGGTELYRSGSVLGTAASITNTMLLGDSGETDAELINNELLYTTGDVLDNAGVPPCKVCAAFQNRLWIGGLEETDLLWFSQPYVFSEGPRFNEALSLRMGFEVTALANLETQLAVFGEDDIQLIVGRGPPATGGLDVGFEIWDVPSDVGCIDPRSVVVYRDGVLFQSRKGIYRLKRDLTVDFVGAAAQGYLDAYPEVTSGVALPDRSEVVFGCTSSAGTASRRLIWNYELDEWSLDTCPRVEEHAAIVWDATDNEWVYSYVIPSGIVHRETTAFSDIGASGAAFITSKWVTPWLKLSTLQDWIRVRGVTLLGKRIQACGVTVEVGFDYQENTWSETYTFTEAVVTAAVSNGRLQLDVPFARQKCEAVRLRITDTAPSGEPETNSAGIELQSLVWTAGFAAGDRYRTDREKTRAA